jgi:ISXO2-like transposase domain
VAALFPLKVEKRSNARTVSHFLQKSVSPDTEQIYINSASMFEGVDFGDAEHASFDHSVEEWVRGDVYTNSIENVWSSFKHSVIGSYHQLGEKHLLAYLGEFSWRLNRGASDHLFVETLKALIYAPALPFKKLTTSVEH